MPKSRAWRSKEKKTYGTKRPFHTDDLKKLKAGPVLRLTNPWSLLRNVWLHVVLYWCRRGREGQRNLKPSSFEFAVDEQGKRYVVLCHDDPRWGHQKSPRRASGQVFLRENGPYVRNRERYWRLSSSEFVYVQAESKVWSSISAASARLERSNRTQHLVWKPSVRCERTRKYDERNKHKSNAVQSLHKSLCSGNSDYLVVWSRLVRSSHLPYFGPQKPEQSAALQSRAQSSTALCQRLVAGRNSGIMEFLSLKSWDTVCNAHAYN